jgi:hypothetical protein
MACVRARTHLIELWTRESSMSPGWGMHSGRSHWGPERHHDHDCRGTRRVLPGRRRCCCRGGARRLGIRLVRRGSRDRDH